MTRLHARVVFDWTYDANPEHYETDDAEEMAEIDQSNMLDNLHEVIDNVPEPEITVEAVKP